MWDVGSDVGWCVGFLVSDLMRVPYRSFPAAEALRPRYILSGEAGDEVNRSNWATDSGQVSVLLPLNPVSCTPSVIAVVSTVHASPDPETQAWGAGSGEFRLSAGFRNSSACFGSQGNSRGSGGQLLDAFIELQTAMWHPHLAAAPLKLQLM